MPMKSEYKQPFSRKHPGLFVFLLDQSISMDERDDTVGRTKAQIVTAYINQIIESMIETAEVEEGTAAKGRRKNYAYISIMGYNDTVYPLLSGDFTPVRLSDLEGLVRGVVPVLREVRSPTGQVLSHVREYTKFWIEPRSEGNTEMTRAFEQAEMVIRSWLNSTPEYISPELEMQKPRKESFPPILINITDAKHNGDGDPQKAAERIKQMHTDKGNVLIYNCHLSHDGAVPCFFPSDITQIRKYTNSKLVEPMFSMSSVIPETLREQALHMLRTPIEPGARCFVYNASPQILLKFLRWTTLGNVMLR